MPAGTSTATGTLPFNRDYVMPTLPALQYPEARYPSRRNQTPAPENPKVIGFQPGKRKMISTPAALWQQHF